MLTLAAEALPELSSDSTRMLKIAMGVYALFLLGVSLVAARRVKNEEDYVVAGRRLPLWLAWGTLMATWFGAATINAAAESAKSDGLQGVILDPFACSATLIFAGLFFAKPLWKMKLFTIADFYRQRYGPKAELIGSAIQVPSNFSWVALQYAALGHIFHVYFDIPFVQGVYWAAGLTMIYTMVGGMWSVTLTDALQLVIALFGLLALGYAVFASPELGNGSVIDGVNIAMEKVRAKHPTHLDFFPSPDAPGRTMLIMGWIGAWATGLFGCIPGQDLQQRVFASKDENVAVKACILAGVLYLVFGMVPVLLGLTSSVTLPDVEGNPIPYLANKYLSSGMTIVLIVSVVAMIVSTATSAVLAPATILGHNLLNRIPGVSRSPLLRDRLCVVFVSAGGVALAMAGESLMGLLDIALSIHLVALFIPVAMGIYGKPRGELTAILAMTFGFAAWSIRFVTEKVLLPIPGNLADKYEYYNEYLADHFPIERLRTAASNWAVIPEDFYGFGCCVIGYLLGQWILKRRERRSSSA
jgi:solute:Na+ symporter, SSS family